MIDNKYFVFLEISYQDLNASKMLFNEGYYPQSLFYLQQSFEKMVKYLGLKEEIVIESELRHPIGHRTSEIFKKVLETHWHFGDFVSREELYNSFQLTKDSLKSTPDKKIVPEIIDLINFFNQADLPKELAEIKQPKDIIEFLKKSEFKDKLDFNQMGEQFDDPLLKTIIEDKFNKMLTNLRDRMKGIQVLFILSAFFERLVTEVRYPNEQLANPIDVYTQEHIIISNMSFFHSETYKCLKVLQL